MKNNSATISRKSHFPDQQVLYVPPELVGVAHVGLEFLQLGAESRLQLIDLHHLLVEGVHQRNIRLEQIDQICNVFTKMIILKKSQILLGCC